VVFQPHARRARKGAEGATGGEDAHGLPAIRVPVLAIQGEDDEYGTAAQIVAVRRQVPRAETLMLAKCGHAPQRDQPEAYAYQHVPAVRSRIRRIIR
jgi:pimeloyl-ACP methyl ester carboxylesterase